VIAFAGIRSRIAAAEAAIVSEGRVAGASATLIRAQVRASPAEFTLPMSHRRENTQQREFLPPPRGTGTHADRQQQCGNGFDLSLWREPGHRETPSSCAIAKLRRCGTRKGPPGSVVEQPTAPRAELVDGHGLLASLVWHRVRPPNHSAADTTRRPSRSDLESLGKRRSAPPVTTAKTASLDQSPASIEALFSHLARRRLRSLAAKEKQA
jgi:hypothetical protein